MFDPKKYNDCCRKLKSFYIFDEPGFSATKEKIHFHKEMEFKSSFLIKRGWCNECGAFWRYEKECVGHQDWELRLIKEVWFLPRECF